jgi:hypothetical protein
MKVGDLVKFIHVAKPEENDVGMITEMDEEGNNLIIWWAKTGRATSSTKAMLAHPQSFEVINESR